MTEIHLRPSWLARDIARAQARLRQWDTSWRRANGLSVAVVPPVDALDAAPTPAHTTDAPEPSGGVHGPLRGRDGGGAI